MRFCSASSALATSCCSVLPLRRADSRSDADRPSQSVKTSTNVPLSTQRAGAGAGEKIVDRKRGIITDTLGLLLAVIVTAASASDNAIGTDLLDRATAAYPTLTKTWVDAGFKNRVVEHGAALGVDVEIVTKDIPGAWMSSSSFVEVVRPGGGLVVEGAGFEASVQDADESIGELAQRGAVVGAAGALPVVVGPSAG